MRKILAVVIIGLGLIGCTRHYVQQTEAYNDKLMLTTIKQTNLLWIPISTRQTVNACEMPAEKQLSCTELMVNYQSDNPL